MDTNYAQYLLEKTRQDYDLIAEDFSKTRQFIWEDLKPMAECIEDGDRVLDLGCGNGRLVDLFKDKNIEYVGVDNSARLIEAARHRYPGKKFLVAGALNLPFPANSFDKVFSIAVLHHIPSEEMRHYFFQEINRVLKPGGLAVVTVWNLWRKKKALSLLFKYTFLKLIGKSKLDFQDIFYPWKNNEGKETAQRYIHLFTKLELASLLKKAGFKAGTAFITKRGKERNIQGTGIKPWQNTSSRPDGLKAQSFAYFEPFYLGSIICLRAPVA
mgnify:CR=1 FL=1